jgi:murein DD-endopeptidase MepM/ murein hydrolase activator NlpD
VSGGTLAIGTAGAFFASIAAAVAAFVMIMGAPAAAESCGASGPGVVVDLATLPRGPVAGWSGEQLENAAYIINAGQALGLDVKAQTIGVMTAMGESGLRVLDYGDAAGRDSRGLFQQRDNGAWGSYRDRMNPTISATNFFKALIKVDDWPELPPTIAAHRVQGNADPYHYTRWEKQAVLVVEALAGTQVVSAAIGANNLCSSAPSTTIPAGGWIKPAAGPLTSGFGMRWGRMHKGADIGAPCSAPILAAAGGVVVGAGPVQGYGNLITIDHGGGVVTAYAHMFDSGVLVTAGQRVPAGAEIGRVGNAGDSRGCHLHFEVRVNEEPIDPVPFMAGRGAALASEVSA